MKLKGQVVSWFPHRHFGFIKPDDISGGNIEYFFHISGTLGQFELGSLVEFELTKPIRLGKPPMATNVRAIEVAS
jgi:cold shock CspA family protein